MAFSIVTQRRPQRQCADPNELAEKTVASAINSYITWRRPSHNDRRYLKRLREWFGDAPLIGIGQEEMNTAAEALYPDRATSTWGRQVFIPMSAVLNYSGAPVRFRKPPQPKTQNLYVSREIAEYLIQNANDADLKALITFLFFTGARLTEAMSLTPDRIDHDRRRVRLRLGKKGIDAWRPLHSRAIEALRSLPPREERIFRWHTNSGAQQALRRFNLKTGIDFTFHMARHSFATWLADDGVNLKDIMEAGGWSSARSVIRYIGSNEERLRRAIDKL